MVAWPVPQTVTELRGFLGLTGYYRRFRNIMALLPNHSLNFLERNSSVGPPAAQHTFDTLKQSMVTTHVLASPNFNETFEVQTDASDIGIYRGIPHTKRATNCFSE